MKLLLLLLFFFLHTLQGADLVTSTQLLKAGEKRTFHPKQGESLAITKDLNRLVSDASYDIVMKNGEAVYFENRNQQDDMYIIFNEPVMRGDLVIVRVNRGYFSYTTERIKALPEPVRKVLKAAARKQKREDARVQMRSHAIVTTEDYCFDTTGEIVPCDAPQATVNQPKAVSHRPQPEVKKERLKAEKPVDTTQQKPAKPENLFATFAEKIERAFQNIKKSLLRQREEAEARKARQSENEQREREKPSDADRGLQAAGKRPQQVTKEPDSAAIEAFVKNTSADDAAFRVVKPHFRPVPLSEEDTVFAHTPVVEKSPVITPHIAARPSLPSAKIAEALPSAPGGTGMDPTALQNDKLSPHAVLEKPALKPEEKPVALPAKPPLPSAEVKGPEISRRPAVETTVKRSDAHTILPRKGLPETVIAQELAKRTLYERQKQKSPAPVAPSKRKEELAVAERITFSSEPMPVAQQQKESPRAETFAQTMPAVPSAEEHLKRSEMGEAQKVQKAVETVSQPTEKGEVEETVQQPVVTEEKHPPSEDKPVENRIVITKIIKKEQQNATPAEPMVRMSDRVLGGGYSDQNQPAKLSVRAYANSKPVSAWVEVFNGKKRVKSFYTGVRKEVKLPAGVYILKATYRTGTAKQKKNLGKVRLKKGESIRKKVYFSIGTLDILARRGGKPLYVKVEIFKKGSRSRYAYTFSSRSTGLAHLQLSQGRYTIVVSEHGNTKTFDDVYVKGGKRKTLVAEF